MSKEFVLKSWNLIQDAMNANNDFIVKQAISELFFLIEIDKMNTEEDFIEFKIEWYPRIKNK